MATYSVAFPDVHLSTNAGFQAFVQHVRDVILTVNPSLLTQTSDTGQIDPLTVASPASSGTGEFWATAYNLFRFNDGTVDIYMKVEYGAAKNLSGTANTDLGVPLIRVSLGLGTNGTGGLLNQYASYQIGNRANHSINTTRGTHNSYACVRTGFLALCFNVGGSGGTSNPYPNSTYCSYSLSFILSRQDSSSNILLLATDTSISFGATDSDTSRYRDLSCCVFDLSNPEGFIDMSLRSEISNQVFCPGYTMNYGGNVLVRRIEVPSMDSDYYDPNCVIYFEGDFSNGSTQTLTVDGISKTFLFLTPALRCRFPYKMNVAIRWE